MYSSAGRWVGKGKELHFLRRSLGPSLAPPHHRSVRPRYREAHRRQDECQPCDLTAAVRRPLLGPAPAHARRGEERKARVAGDEGPRGGAVEAGAARGAELERAGSVR